MGRFFKSAKLKVPKAEAKLLKSKLMKILEDIEKGLDKEIADYMKDPKFLKKFKKFSGKN